MACHQHVSACYALQLVHQLLAFPFDPAGTIEQQIAHLLLYLISTLSDPDAEPEEVKELQARLDQVHAGLWHVAGQATWPLMSTCGHAHAFVCAASSHPWAWMHVAVANR